MECGLAGGGLGEPPEQVPAPRAIHPSRLSTSSHLQDVFDDLTMSSGSSLASAHACEKDYAEMVKIVKNAFLS